MQAPKQLLREHPLYPALERLKLRAQLLESRFHWDAAANKSLGFENDTAATLNQNEALNLEPEQCQRHLCSGRRGGDEKLKKICDVDTLLIDAAREPLNARLPRYPPVGPRHDR